MTCFFTPRRKARLRIAGVTALLGIAGQHPLSAQSPTAPCPVEAQTLEDRTNSNGVLAPLRLTALALC
jgi:hypothetical protein